VAPAITIGFCGYFSCNAMATGLRLPESNAAMVGKHSASDKLAASAALIAMNNTAAIN